MFIIEKYLIPFLFFALSVSLYGQNEETVKLRFVTFPKTAETLKAELFLGLRKPEEITAASNTISQPVLVPQMKEWIIGETSVTPEGKKDFNVFGKVPATPSKEQIVLILRTGPEFSDGIKLVLIDDTKLDFGLGKILFLNATKVRIGGIVGEDKFDIRPGTFKVIKPEPNETGLYYHARLFYAKDGQPKGFYSSNWPYTTKTRAMVFIYEDPSTGKIMRHVVRGAM